MKNLKKIDFNDGIRSENINYNFLALSEQIASDRLSTYGYGIAKGLDIIINGFDLKITAGTLINYEGYLIDTPETNLKIEKPILNKVTEKKMVETNGKITLTYIPYDTKRLSSATIDSNNISITISGTDNKIRCRNIEDNVLTVSDVYSGNTFVNVTYEYAEKRIDAIYISKDNEVKLLQGTPSSSPSVFPIDKNDAVYILGYLLIDPYYSTNLNIKNANVLFFEDLRVYKKIYTDENNILYIEGQPFNNLKIIYMNEPLVPKLYDFWYDIKTNTLKVFLNIDGIEDWHEINKTTMFNACEVYRWEENNNPLDHQIFIFDPMQINMRFIPNRNELAIHINQAVLHYDQYKEITFEDLKKDINLRNIAIQQGYTEDMINKTDKDVENIGIGFKLATPLENDCYVEAIVTQRTKTNPINTRFQRSATFCYENYIWINKDTKGIILNKYFRYDENQLNIYINGKKLIKNIDYIEGLENETYEKGVGCNCITLKTNVDNNTLLNYQINTSIYSYDTVDSTMGNAISKSQEVLEKTEETFELVSELENTYRTAVTHPTFISKRFTKNNNIMMLENIKPNDYINVFKETANGSFLLLRKTSETMTDYDYDISKSTDGQTMIQFKNISNDTVISITGIKMLDL